MALALVENASKIINKSMFKNILISFLVLLNSITLLSASNEESCRKLRLNYSALKNKCVTNEEACAIIDLIYDAKIDECISKEEACEKNGLVYDENTKECKSLQAKEKAKKISVEFERKLEKDEICTPNDPNNPKFPECKDGLECQPFEHTGVFKCKPIKE